MINPIGRLGAAFLGAALLSVGASSAQVALPEAIEAETISTDAFSTGLLTAAEGALPATLWEGASTQTVEFLLDNLPQRPAAPSLGEALRRILLSPGPGPNGAQPSLGGKKLVALARAGFVNEAATIASLSSAPRGDPWVGQAEAISDLLSGDAQAACAKSASLADGQQAPFWVKLRVFCYARAGEQDAADLSLGILRDQYGLSVEDDLFLSAAVTGLAPKTPKAPTSPLQFAIMQFLELPTASAMLAKADGGVLTAIALSDGTPAATRIAAAGRALAMGVFEVEATRSLFESIAIEDEEGALAATLAGERADDPLSDVLLYRSVKAMTAPELLRDKAQRIALALSKGDSFYRAYALSVLYADEIASLEGALLAPDEAAHFAVARMAVGDSVGAGAWLSAMLSPGASVGALTEANAMQFIDLVNLLGLLDPQTASQIARAGEISILKGPTPGAEDEAQAIDPAVASHILEAAFDAAIGAKRGQAGLVALAASQSAHAATQAVIVTQSLKAAGMEDLQRRYGFERAWAASFPGASTAQAGKSAGDEAAEDGGFIPRVKPSEG